MDARKDKSRSFTSLTPWTVSMGPVAAPFKDDTAMQSETTGDETVPSG